MQPMIDGTRYSLVASTEKELKYKYRELLSGAKLEKRVPLTVGDAIDRYIESQSGTLSPSTISVYKRYRKNYLQRIIDCYLSDLTQELIQSAISTDSKNGKSPKTIRNAYGLLMTSIRMFRPKFKPEIKLPQKEKYEISIPSEEEIQKIWKEAKGTKYEIPILLASWLGLRMSEIRGLKYSDIVGNKIHIQRAVVHTAEGDAEKGTKSFSGDRWITCPKTLIDLIELQSNKSEYICRYSESAIYNNFVRLCIKAGIKHYRFHDLRHFAASEAHSLGVPNKYQMKRMGHKTDDMLKKVYQHTMRDKEDSFADLIDKQMESLYK